jgi:hypothetical protein
VQLSPISSSSKDTLIKRAALTEIDHDMAPFFTPTQY